MKTSLLPALIPLEAVFNLVRKKVSGSCSQPAGADDFSFLIHVGIDIQLDCRGSSTVYTQGCLTVGTEPFSLLNGTYKTLTFYLERICSDNSLEFPDSSESGDLSCSIDTDKAPLQFCITQETAEELVNSQEGSWGLVIG